MAAWFYGQFKDVTAVTAPTGWPKK